MFDIGFWELALIGVIALLVIGPERLPGVAHTVGMWIGKGKRLISSVQSDINREVGKAEELKHLLEEQKKIVERHEILEDFKQEIPLGNQPTDKKNKTLSQDSSQGQANSSGTKKNSDSIKNAEHE